MRIVYLLRYWPVFGGGETVTRALVNEMCKRNHEVTVVYLWDRTNDTDIFVDKRSHSFKVQNITNIKDGSIPKSEYKKLEFGLKSIFDEIKPDIIVNQWLPSEVVVKAAKGLSAKVIKCHHGVIKFVPNITTLKQKIFYRIFGDKAGWLRVYPELRRDYLYSDAWVLLSEASKRDAKYLLKKADEKKLKVITNPLPYYVDQSKIDLNEKKKEIIYVGRIIELKRVGYLLEAWKLIENKVPAWTFRIIGDGTYIENEKNKAKHLALKNVIFEGFKESKEFMMNASILMMASNQEGFSMVIIEAQQCGCVPIVVDSFPTVHDIIKNEKNGILVEDNNIKKFADEVYKLILDKDRRNRIARQGMVDSQKFSVEELCDKWELLFESLEISRR